MRPSNTIEDFTAQENGSKKYTTPSRQGEYAKLAKLLPTAIEKLSLMLESHNESVRMSAINKILDKCLPDIKSVELSGVEGKDLEFKIHIVKERELPAGKE